MAKPRLNMRWILPCAVLCLGSAAVAAPLLRVGVTENDAPPSLILSKSVPPQLTGGLWKALLDEVGRTLGRDMRYLPVPRKRLSRFLLNGQIDISCNTNPAWWRDASGFAWSRPLGEQVERLVSSKNSPLAITQLSQLDGLRIGTVIGYRYPVLDQAFANGAQRIDQQHADMQPRAAMRQLVDVAIIDQLGFAWWQKTHAAEAAQVKLQPLVLSRMPLHCAVSRRSPLGREALDRAINHLEKQGTLAAIYRSYQPQ